MEKSNCILIIGANSDVAKAFAFQADQQGFQLILASRNSEASESYATNFNQKPILVNFDSLNPNSFIAQINASIYNFDIAIYFPGALHAEKSSTDSILETITINYSSGVIVLHAISDYFKKKKQGVIVGISSVAGERGKQSTYIYGSAKAGFTTFLSELRNQLFPFGIEVITIIPGFMKSKMLTKKTPDFLTASPELAAKQILKAIRRKKNIAFITPRWRMVMWIIKMIPENIFKKLKL